MTPEVKKLAVELAAVAPGPFQLLGIMEGFISNRKQLNELIIYEADAESKQTFSCSCIVSISGETPTSGNSDLHNTVHKVLIARGYVYRMGTFSYHQWRGRDNKQVSVNLYVS